MYASVFDKPEEVSINAYSITPKLLVDISGHWGIQRLRWFTRGLYLVKSFADKIVLSDLRMGAECNYVFNFIIAEMVEHEDDSSAIIADFVKFSQRPDLSTLNRVWQRIADHSVFLKSAPDYKNCVEIPELD